MTMSKIKAPITMKQISNFTDLVRSVGENPQYPVYHHFSPGVYVREFHMPAGFLVVGKKHKTRHLNILTKGICEVWTPEGKYYLDATDKQCTFESLAGVKKVVYAKTDIIWMTVHVTNEGCLNNLEGDIIDAEEQLDLFPELDIIPINNDIQKELEEAL